MDTVKRLGGISAALVLVGGAIGLLAMSSSVGACEGNCCSPKTGAKKNTAAPKVRRQDQSASANNSAQRDNRAGREDQKNIAAQNQETATANDGDVVVDARDTRLNRAAKAIVRDDDAAVISQKPRNCCASEN